MSEEGLQQEAVVSVAVPDTVSDTVSESVPVAEVLESKEPAEPLSDVSPESKDESKEPAPVKEEPIFTQLPFIEETIKKIPLVTFQESYRITPQGLFFSLTKKTEILDFYRTWLKEKAGEKTGDEVKEEIKEGKLVKKLFNTDAPERFYLLEGKKCLCGYFVPAVIQNPPQYRLPYYLGSPNSAFDYLHPSDPLFTEVDGVRSTQGKAGLELIVTVRDKEVTVSLIGLRHFMKLARNSKKIAKFYPRATLSLSDAARAFIQILRKAKLVKIEEEPVRPMRFEKDGENLVVLQRSGFYILLQARRLAGLYHVYGKNFYFMIRDEIAIDLGRATRGRIGSFEIFNRKNKNVGTLLINGVKHALSGEAVVGFINEALESPAFIKQPKGPKTVRHYIEQLIDIVQTAQPIETAKVISYLKPKYRKGHKVLVNDVWMFVISSRYELVACISRTAKNRSE